MNEVKKKVMLRNPDSIPAGDTIIKDPAIEPFFITRPQVGGYVVYEKVVKGENKNNYLKTVAYPASFNHALKVVAREMVNSASEGNYESIESYINEWKKIQKKLSNLTPIDV